jgi:hypothetical protein
MGHFQCLPCLAARLSRRVGGFHAPWVLVVATVGGCSAGCASRTCRHRSSKSWLKPLVRTMLVSVLRTAAVGGQPLRDTELSAWCGEVIRSVLADLPVP